MHFEQPMPHTIMLNFLPSILHRNSSDSAIGKAGPAKGRGMPDPVLFSQGIFEVPKESGGWDGWQM